MAGRGVSRWCKFFCGAVLWAACGCGRESGEKFLAVAGRVTLEGKTLAIGSVSFRPDTARGNGSQHIPIGTIAEDGTYELVTIKQKGAPPGWYRVVVHADANMLKTGNAARPLPPSWLTNAKYTDERTSDLAVEVVENPVAGAYDLKLKK